MGGATIFFLCGLAACLAVLVWDQRRFARMDHSGRKGTVPRRGLLGDSRSASQYLRHRFIPGFAALCIVGALFIVFAFVSTHDIYSIGATIAVVAIVLGVFGYIGRLNYKRLARRDKNGWEDSNGSQAPW